MNSRFLFVSALALAAFSSAFANPVGKWTGKMEFAEAPKIPADATPQQKKAMQDGMAQIKKIVMTMEIKKDKSYVVTMTGTPTKQPPSTGKWSQAGNVLSFTSPTSKTPQKMTISKDGKTLTSDLIQPGVKIKMTFKKA